MTFDGKVLIQNHHSSVGFQPIQKWLRLGCITALPPAAHQLQGTARGSPQSVGLAIGPARTSCPVVLRQHHSRPAPSQGDKPFATPDGGIAPSLAFAHRHAGRPRACVHPLWRQPHRFPLSTQPERRVDVSRGHACNFVSSIIQRLHPRPLRHASHGHGPHVLQLMMMSFICSCRNKI